MASTGVSPIRKDFEGHRQRLRSRFEKSGFQGFSDYEVIELLLTLAIPRQDVKQPAKALIAKFKNLRGILDAPLDELREVKGLGSVAPVALRVIRETANLYLEQSAEQRDSFADPGSLTRYWRTKIGSLPHEVFYVAYLDSGYRLLRNGIEVLEEGTTDRAAVYPRKVIEAALRRSAAAVVISHNHPDWVVVQKQGKLEINWIIETKGRVWEGTDAKDSAMENWCARVSEQTGLSWKFCRINQIEFDHAKSSNLNDLVTEGPRLI